MSDTIYEYRIRCITDNRYESVLLKSGSALPTKCPVDGSHVIDTSNITIIKTYNQNKVQIEEENIATGGHYGTTTVSLVATHNTKSSKNVSWPFPISVLAIQFVTEEQHRGDVVSLLVGPDTVIGIITSDVSPASAWVDQNYTAGQSVVYNAKVYTCIVNTTSNENPSNNSFWRQGLELNVSPTVIANTAIGYYIKLSDNTNQDNVERVIGVDETNDRIYVENNLVNSFSIASPTYVQQTIKPIANYEIGPAWAYTVGTNKIGSSYIPANTIVTIEYENKSADTDKQIIGEVEFLY